VVGPERFVSEIIWTRSHAHNSAIRYGPNHDVILYYGKTDHITWNRTYQEYDPGYVAKHYRHVDKDGRHYKHENPTGAGIRHGVTGQSWRGIDPTAKGRHWANTPDEMERLDAQGLIHWPDKKGAWPYVKVYLDQMPGTPVQDTWNDIDPINMMALERLGYPTQKPEALLERIVAASSNAGDTVLDPFCGCGTTIAAAQKLGRRWIGIDITHLAISLIRARLKDAYGDAVVYKVIGEPTTVEDAEVLAESDPYQFQWWALGLVGARPVEQKKGADKGIDGRLYFHDGTASGKTHQVILSVKAGTLHANYVRDLVGVLSREKAEMGVLISFEEPTKPMRKEAASAGFYESPWGKHSRLQLLTVGELLDGKRIDYPQTAGVNRTFKQAPKARKVAERDRGLFDREDET
jgi:hypothetical protein